MIKFLDKPSGRSSFAGLLPSGRKKAESRPHPQPLPYKGGERLPPCPPQELREALPSLVGEGQGWGQILY